MDDVRVMEMKPCKRRQMDESDESRLSNVPEHILVEILIRLPSSKYAYQCKLVCKLWNSNISSPYFYRQCIAYNNTKINSFTIVSQWFTPYINKFGDSRMDSQLFSLTQDHTNTYKFRNLNLSFLEQNRSKYVLQASCRDLLLLTSFDGDFIRSYVVNPFTLRWICLPRAPHTSRKRLTNTCSKRGLLLCDDHNSDSSFNVGRFKVIRMLYIPTNFIEMLETCPTIGIDNAEFSVQIYSSDSNEWDEYTMDWYPFKYSHFLGKTPIVSHNGMFNWVNGNSLCSLNPFDLVVEDYVPTRRQMPVPHRRLRPTRIIDLPEKNLLASDNGIDANSKRVLLGLGVAGAHLRVIIDHINNGNQHSLFVWELEEGIIRTGCPWRLVHKMEFNPKLSTQRPFRFNFMGFHPHQTDTIFLAISNFICQMNSTSKYTIISQKQVQRNYSFRRSLPFVVQQWFPTQLPNL